ncbi:MAG: alkaline phosphatase family protein [Flavobacteriia bacterium]
MKIKRTGKVLVIGWDAADWKVIEPLIQQGKMPAIQRLMEGGVYGRLQTLDPPLSPMLWTSIATGVRADKHGIGGFIEPLPDGSGLRPVTSTSRKVKAIWNILNQEGLKSNVVSWWPSNPAEPINGVMVSNLYQVAVKPLDEEWPMPKGTIHPVEMEESMKEWRIHPQEITISMTAPFIPNVVNDKELRKEKRVYSVTKVLAEASTVHAASTYLMEKTKWDFMAVYYDAIDHFSHLAMRYHPPRRSEIDEKDYNNYKEVVEAGYRYHDMMLERTLEMIDKDTTVILISDHGFHSDHQRPLYIPKEPSGPAVEHSPYGIIVMNGPGIKKGRQEISGSSIIDITPTLLALYGLPVGKDMEGKVLYQAFEDPTQVDYIESWEDVQGDSGMHSKELLEDPWAAQEALQQLVELGYIDALEDDKLQQVEKAKRESKYYVARNMINGGRIEPALDILEEIFEESKITRYGQRLAFAYLSLKMYKKCREIIDELKSLEQKKISEAKETLLNKKDNSKMHKKDKDPFGNKELEEPMYLDYLEGLLYMAINMPWKALPILEKVQKKNKNNAELAVNIGRILNLRRRFRDAEKYFIKALAIDDRNASAHYGLGLSFLRRNKMNEAIEEFLLAVDQNFYIPNVHYHLGETLVRVKDFESASQAFEVAIRLSPGMTRAHKWLVDIYSNQLGKPEKAKEHIDFIKNNIKGELIIVTGLLGSGVETVLNALENGGVEVLRTAKGSDGKKGNAGAFEEIIRLKKDDNRIQEARNKATMVYLQHLNNLPAFFDYKVIFIDRDIHDVLANQTNVKDKVKLGILPAKALSQLQEQLDKFNMWISSQPNIRTLNVNFGELSEHPEEYAEVIAEFLGREMELEKMTEILKVKD